MEKNRKAFVHSVKNFAVIAVTAIVLCAAIFSGCGHSHSLERVAAKSPTCIAEGHAEYWECKDCGEMFSDAEGKNPATLQELTIEKLPHSYELKVTVAGGEYTEGECLTRDKLTFSLHCRQCTASENVTEGVTVDLSEPLNEGANNFTAVYNGKNTVFTVNAKAKEAGSAQVEVTCDKIFHAGQTVQPSDLKATLVTDGRPAESITEFEILNASVTAETDEIVISYGGKTAKTPITVHAVTHEAHLDSTVDSEGRAEHYACNECGKNFDMNFSELSTIVIPRMQAFSVTDTKIGITNSDGKSVGLKTEQGKTFLSGNPNDYYGRIFMKYNFSVDKDTKIKFYVNTSTRDGHNNINDVYSVKINGTEVISGDSKLPQGTNNWFSETYSAVGEGELIGGRNNVIEVTRVNLINKTLGGALTYNFFGIGITPSVAAQITFNAPCSHICVHCGGCTDADNGNEACAAKCAGHEGEHFCESVCKICGECNDENCTEEVCANKCGCTEFTVMHSSVTAVNKDGGTVNKNTAANEQNISANDSNAKKGLIRITYRIHSESDASVNLYIKTCSQAIENTLAESYGFTVNGQPADIDGSIKMPYNEANKWKDIRYTRVGEIRLKQGDNVIEIVRFDMTERELNDYTGFNFFGIAVSGNVTVTWTENN